jgi:hypothetical protein
MVASADSHTIIPNIGEESESYGIVFVDIDCRKTDLLQIPARVDMSLEILEIRQ